MNQSKRVSDETKFRDCPFCAETIKAAAVTCRYCGKDMPRGGLNPTIIGGSTGIIFRVFFWLFVFCVGLPLLLGLAAAILD